MLKDNYKELNGRDDWLAQELERESRVSAWDFDEGRSLRYEHRENCDREALATEHHIDHLNRNRVVRQSAPSMAWLIIDVVFLFLMFVQSILMPFDFYGPSLMMFFLLFFGIVISLAVSKRLPSTWFFVVVFFVSLFFEVFMIAINWRLIMFFLRRYLR